MRNAKQGNDFKDVRAHCYCASLVRTLCMTWPRHVFEARAPSRNSIKYRAGDLCGNLICKYFCSIIGDPHFFFGRSLPFVILSNVLKDKRNLTFFKVNSTWINDICNKDLSNRPLYAVLNAHNLDMILQLKYMPIVMNTAKIASSDWKF